MSGEYSIIIDSREQKPYEFAGQASRFEQLNVGDYTIEGYADEFAVERKTLDDLARSLGADRERFEDEMRRAVEANMDHLEVVIEAPEWYVADYAGTKHSPKYYSDIYPNSILGTVDAWPDKYSPVGFTWAQNRDGGQQETLRLLDSWYVKREM
jgi:hypothetical protein